MQVRIPTPTVGEIITDEFMKPLNMSIEVLAKGIELSEYETHELLSGRLYVTPELSGKLSQFFGMSEFFFYRLQKNLDMRNVAFSHEEIRERELALV